MKIVILNAFDLCMACTLAFLPVAAQPPATGTQTPKVEYVKGRGGTPAGAHMAIANVCAWPTLILLPDGAIVAVIHNQPSHGRMVGDAETWASRDGGRTWQKRGVPAPHEPGTLSNRLGGAFGLALNGELVLISAGWSLVPKNDEPGQLEIDKLQRPWVSRSRDGGRSWTIKKEGFPATGPDGGMLVPGFNIQAGKDGALRAAAYSVLDKSYHTFVLRSDDDGYTWKDPLPIDSNQRLNETDLWHAGGGRWLAAARHSRLELYQSLDDARTWQRLMPLTEQNAIPGQFLALKDGRLLLANGNRTKGDERVEVRISSDGGNIWSAPVRVTDFVGFDGGYPSSVQGADGLVVTAFYAKNTAYFDGYHMGVVIWDPDVTFPRGKALGTPAAEVDAHL